MSFFYGYVSSKEDQNINGKVHSIDSPGSVPFSWEQHPGICKTSQRPRPLSSHSDSGSFGPKLPLPPCQAVPNKAVGHRLSLHPPHPSAFQRQRQSSRNSGGGGGSQKIKKNKKEEDPFAAALLECTRDGVDQQKKKKMKKKEIKILPVGFPVRRKLHFSCKHTCVVREGNIVRHPQSLYPTPLHSSTSSCKPSVRIKIDKFFEEGLLEANILQMRHLCLGINLR